jgi:hypothetical protein
LDEKKDKREKSGNSQLFAFEEEKQELNKHTENMLID